MLVYFCSQLCVDLMDVWREGGGRVKKDWAAGESCSRVCACAAVACWPTNNWPLPAATAESSKVWMLLPRDQDTSLLLLPLALHALASCVLFASFKSFGCLHLDILTGTARQRSSSYRRHRSSARQQ